MQISLLSLYRIPVYSWFDLDMIYCNYLFENGSVMQMSHNKYTIHEKYTKSYTTKDMLYFYKYKNIDADVGSSMCTNTNNNNVITKLK